MNIVILSYPPTVLVLGWIKYLSNLSLLMMVVGPTGRGRQGNRFIFCNSKYSNLISMGGIGWLV